MIILSGNKILGQKEGEKVSDFCERAKIWEESQPAWSLKMINLRCLLLGHFWTARRTSWPECMPARVCSRCGREK